MGLFPKQKGPLKANITQLEADITIMIDSAKCPRSVGFDVQIKDVYVDARNTSIKI